MCVCVCVCVCVHVCVCACVCVSVCVCLCVDCTRKVMFVDFPEELLCRFSLRETIFLFIFL